MNKRFYIFQRFPMAKVWYLKEVVPFPIVCLIEGITDKEDLKSVAERYLYKQPYFDSTKEYQILFSED